MTSLLEENAALRLECAEWQRQALYHNKKHGEVLTENRALQARIDALTKLVPADPVELSDNKVMVRFEMAVCECRQCGVHTPFATKVLGAVGHYCHICAGTIAILAHNNTDRQLRKGLAHGIVKLPTEDYDPKSP